MCFIDNDCASGYCYYTGNEFECRENPLSDVMISNGNSIGSSRALVKVTPNTSYDNRVANIYDDQDCQNLISSAAAEDGENDIYVALEDLPSGKNDFYVTLQEEVDSLWTTPCLDGDLSYIITQSDLKEDYNNNNFSLNSTLSSNWENSNDYPAHKAIDDDMDTFTHTGALVKRTLTTGEST